MKNQQQHTNKDESEEKEFSTPSEGSTETSAESTETSPIAEEISEIDQLKAELEEANNKYLRLYAEFDNYKRRTSKERVELLQTAGKEVIVDMLGVLDDFDRAQKSIEKATEIASVKEGLDLVHQKLKSTLVRKGLKEMEVEHMPFDAELHEAITKIPSPSPELEGKILDLVEKGYYLNDKVVRHAKVVVGG